MDDFLADDGLDLDDGIKQKQNRMHVDDGRAGARERNSGSPEGVAANMFALCKPADLGIEYIEVGNYQNIYGCLDQLHVFVLWII